MSIDCTLIVVEDGWAFDVLLQRWRIRAEGVEHPHTEVSRYSDPVEAGLWGVADSYANEYLRMIDPELYSINGIVYRYDNTPVLAARVVGEIDEVG